MEVTALGKKRHRVEMARRLVLGSVVGSFENQKNILYPHIDMQGNVLVKVLDSSLPWWTERDSWGRWSTATQKVNSLSLANEAFKVCNSISTGRIETVKSRSAMTLSDVVEALADSKGESPVHHSRILAMYIPLWFCANS